MTILRRHPIVWHLLAVSVIVITAIGAAHFGGQTWGALWVLSASFVSITLIYGARWALALFAYTGMFLLAASVVGVIVALPVFAVLISLHVAWRRHRTCVRACR
ncbi:hypothetical protein BIV57_11840 [Mangrovactinospora gilvigrisea]|uniref:Uncharacterized protein n=1 Tax=Mangrovactinospora gilvigrisea TaxID=1428644 RepID=A0A1J7C6W0_9ACTN|nr:hypothetical protein [Mangrovactinospora gilvigrisea]OIV37268.1 hypothetical protein BIV57_11840 [Mangrovactinospora gilvigrisea]